MCYQRYLEVLHIAAFILVFVRLYDNFIEKI